VEKPVENFSMATLKNLKVAENKRFFKGSEMYL
jgi:hypothetical protein